MMKPKVETLDLRVRRVAFASALANTILGLLLALYTLYILLTPFALIPLIGYWLLYGYWRRATRRGEPMLWLWNLTIWYNLAGLALPFVMPELVHQPIYYALLAWNGFMVVGAALAHQWDEELAHLRRRQTGDGWLERIEEELPN